MAAIASGLIALDGQATAQGSCLGSESTVRGTTGDDNLVGTDGDDVIDAFGGDDLVDGGGGNDKICLGDGSDGAQGGAGNDQIEGGTGDDSLAGDFLESNQTGAGDDEVAGGEGHDIVVADAASSSGPASGEGDDKANGGSGNDIVVGDAFSSSLSAGTGDDDIDLGPGTDIAVGDALTGLPGMPAAAPSAEAAAAGVTAPMALGTGSESGGGFDAEAVGINAQTEDDVLVGDAAVFGSTTGARGAGAVDVLAECSKLAARRIRVLRQIWPGIADAEILDFIPDRIRGEFQLDLLVGDCLSVGGSGGRTGERGAASVGASSNGAAPDDLNSGTDDDVSYGDNLSTGSASGNQSGDEEHLGGTGADIVVGDHGLARATASGLSSAGGVRAWSVDLVPQARQPTLPGDFDDDGIVDGSGFALWSQTFGVDVSVGGGSGQRGAGGTVSGGGDDHARGGKGGDYLEGGPKKDKCSGGPQKDDFVERGPNKCEQITGAP